ncbi:transglycosylase SLT domain-containing protein [Rouxiella badensis]|jgi:soluble lytic murein transglycosylase-like protein|uniref:transglycosylase SLT domain-containing protein n=1 Tax=Rouxiella badensis TaxID=1646377 RepID=UPI000476EFD1|nr:transglycosylase SLT domain-containing protein [Rouxiella badensis]MCC3704289.1 transglycosylase SLT domain-containing protein [Rouxiella badensis]MCC3720812.1 transglycosylase SLT domain-containing protein [Rouxiella badensis]MCC3730651.1 transglycosylase SLT domain-containing protein [Rouxiella badensis]MCC3734854.1 transglycosylase SLT domain-containing protein [Rouxiella badensis]MCC3741851.1 transglycosylase SLT domain-containing protein [Rouxiella badensis]
MCRILIVLSYFIFFTSAQAHCWQEAGERYGIEPELLQAIGIVESNLNPTARNNNKDGSYDIGLMQINSRNMPALNKFNITEQQLVDNPCLSVMSGAWILAGMIRQKGYSWEAVGGYNAGLSPKRAHLRKRYIKRVWPQYRRLVQQRPAKLR